MLSVKHILYARMSSKRLKFTSSANTMKPVVRAMLENPDLDQLKRQANEVAILTRWFWNRTLEPGAGPSFSRAPLSPKHKAGVPLDASVRTPQCDGAFAVRVPLLLPPDSESRACTAPPCRKSK